MSETNRKSCLCQICCNLSLKSEAYKSFSSKDNFKDIEHPPYDKHQLMESTLCKKDACLSRECQNCGTGLLVPIFETVSQKSTDDSVQITWYKWEHITVDREDNSTKRIISCVRKTTSFDAFMNDLQKDMQGYPSHRFRATWQHDQLIKCLSTLKKEELMTIMDFFRKLQM